MFSGWGAHKGRYIVSDEGQPVAEIDLLAWADWMEKPFNCIVKQELMGGVRVSTVFLGLDHNFYGKGPPILWETMIFGGPLDEEMRRYSSLGAAILGHEEMCIAVLIAGPFGPERCLPAASV